MTATATSDMEMTLPNILDDLTVRFLLNLPRSELQSIPRLCFQVEEAQWFYEDFIRPLAATASTPLPSLPLRQFCLALFQHCPLLSGFTDAEHVAAYEEFLAYKVRVPVRGAILMDEACERVVLVKGWKKGSSWSFPRGKINKDERDLDCAVREVYEETGFDVRAAGLVGQDDKQADEDVKYIDVTMREQHMRLFVFRGVPLDTLFEPQTRKEISKIAWYNVKDLPGFKKQKHAQDKANQANKFYMVAPFLGPLRKWISVQKKKDVARDVRAASMPVPMPAAVGEDENIETQARESAVPMNAAPPTVDKSEELRRLMGIGTVPAMQPQPPSFESASTPNLANVNDGQSSHLLSLLQGSAQPKPAIPQTPLDQIDQAFPPQEPISPHPRHPRHPNMQGFQQSVPDFAFSPQRLHAQGMPPHQSRNFSVPAMLGQQSMRPTPPPGLHAQGQQAQQPLQNGLPAWLQPHLTQRPQPQPPQQLQEPQQQQNFPAPIPQPTPPFAIPQRQPIQPPQLGAQIATHSMLQHPPSQAPTPTAADATIPSIQQLHQQPHRPLNAPFAGLQDPHVAQGSYGARDAHVAIQAGPAVPKAGELPMPKLNAHSMGLLEALKSGGGRSGLGPDAGQPGAAREPSTQHQNALLELFRRPSQPASGPNSAMASNAEDAREQAVSPTPADFVIRPAMGNKERRTTLAEITRTLPARMKPKSPQPMPVQQAPPRQQPQQSAQRPPMTAAAPSEAHPSQATEPGKQLFNPSNPQHFVRASKEAGKPAQGAPDPQIKIMQRQAPQTAQQHQQPPPPPPPPHRVSPKPGRASNKSAKGQENGTPASSKQQAQPAFKILQRPSSDATGKQTGAQSPAFAPMQASAQQASSGPGKGKPASEKNGRRAQPPPQPPQVLKRPESVDPTIVQKAAEFVEEKRPSVEAAAEGDKREQLLALFGQSKPAASSTDTAAISPTPKREEGITSPSHTPRSMAPQKAREQEGFAVGKEDKKKTELLELFAGTRMDDEEDAAATPTAAAVRVDSAAAQSRRESAALAKDGLMSLLNSPTHSSAAASMPPPAPTIAPSRQSSRQPPTISTTHAPQLQHQKQLVPHHTRQQTPQNALLDLFTRPGPSSGAGSGLAHHQHQSKDSIPGTPISPFALGTPASKTTFHQTRDGDPFLSGLQHAPDYGNGFPHAAANNGLRRESNAMTENGNGGGSRSASRTGGSATPTGDNNKEFLLGFLNGVVKKAGG
ncbi:DCP2-domain-containing protein [Hortaea werneckii]|nr:DCP2-domain-containing protein [Hortaea werneckii]KAI7236448.1 DCP2-domain-containing protein [Hortaea werneckii]KAI7318523.1 DCP2-domain-containing protein [Hortaea werneckii]KAI7402285.1 DCP2-domain-containing protein [Hortaea werneckii]KAI7487038.1 DCP2-domain-containing protein [Hortaea werneckii]